MGKATQEAERPAHEGDRSVSSGAGRVKRVATKRRRGSAITTGEARFAWKLISPSLIVLVAVTTLPFLALIGMSLSDLKLTGTGLGFAGLANYERLFTDSQFYSSLIITAIYTGVTVVAQLLLGLGLAFWFLRSFSGRKFLSVAVVLPMILAPVVVGLAWKTFLLTPKYGLIDYLAQLFGAGSQPWLTNPTFALVCVIAVHTWQWTPFAFLVFLASLHGLPTEVTEAAQVDGASTAQLVRFIMLPMIKAAIAVVAIIRIVWALRAFDAILALTGGGPGTATEVLNLYVYDVAFSDLDLGYAATLGVVLLVISVAVSLIFFRWQRSSSE